MKHDVALCGAWERYHVIRAAMTRQLGVLAPRDLAARVQAQIHADVGAPAASLRFWPLASGFAAAASIAMIAVFGWQAWRDPIAPIAVAPTAVAVGEEPALAATVVAVGGEPTVVTAVVSSEPTALAATVGTAAKPRRSGGRLHDYVFGHNEFVPTGGLGNMLPYARVVADNPER
jgi:negative regulator of sigma E activity